MSPRRSRLDAELVRRGLARSRGLAAELIAAGRVQVSGLIVAKPATSVGLDAAIVVDRGSDDPGYASRGAYKLLGAIQAFRKSGLLIEGRRCLDAGASTGGFTDVLLRAGAATVLAVDVGYGQLDWRLRTDERVQVYDRTNVRDLAPRDLGDPVDLVVADLSFISLRLVLPALAGLSAPDADWLLMVKPQFEVGRDQLGSRGVVRDPKARVAAVHGVLDAAARRGWATRGVVASPLPGPAGNIEYFGWLQPSPSTGSETMTQTSERIAAMVATAVAAGPSRA